MRPFLLIMTGFVLAVASGIVIYACQITTHPLGAVTNLDYAIVQISRLEGKPLCELHKGEAKSLEYGEYTIYIPEIKATFVLAKNNRGTCFIHSADGTLLVEANENASLLNASKNYNKR